MTIIKTPILFSSPLSSFSAQSNPYQREIEDDDVALGAQALMGLVLQARAAPAPAPAPEKKAAPKKGKR
jgi:hypothetical protein